MSDDQRVIDQDRGVVNFHGGKREDGPMDEPWKVVRSDTGEVIGHLDIEIDTAARTVAFPFLERPLARWYDDDEGWLGPRIGRSTPPVDTTTERRPGADWGMRPGIDVIEGAPFYDDLLDHARRAALDPDRLAEALFNAMRDEALASGHHWSVYAPEGDLIAGHGGDIDFKDLAARALAALADTGPTGDDPGAAPETPGDA